VNHLRQFRDLNDEEVLLMLGMKCSIMTILYIHFRS
jgi:hypothetical protein